jgi:hypothetical protein
VNLGPSEFWQMWRSNIAGRRVNTIDSPRWRRIWFAPVALIAMDGDRDLPELS